MNESWKRKDKPLLVAAGLLYLVGIFAGIGRFFFGLQSAERWFLVEISGGFILMSLCVVLWVLARDLFRKNRRCGFAQRL